MACRIEHATRADAAAVAVIGGAEPASVRLHAARGFVAAGRMSGVGRTHGCRLDMLYGQRALGRGDEQPPREEHA